MDCSTCGHPNPGNLVFCQQCGQRLAARAVAPTPPVALGAPQAAYSPRAATSHPPAPPAWRGSAPPPQPHGSDRICPRCAKASAASFRFCVACGHDFTAASAAPAPAPAREPSAPPPSPASRYSSAPATPATRVCLRCHHPLDADSAFCKSCGNPVAQGAAPVPARWGSDAQRSPSGTASVAQRGRLIIVAKNGEDGPAYPIGDQLDIGRAEGNVMIADDAYLSPRHARIVHAGGKLLLRDLGSVNGVYLRISSARGRVSPANPGEIAIPLADHDLILVGQQVLKFEALLDAEAGFGHASQHGTLLFGSPACPRYGRLTQRTVEGADRDVFYIRKVETVLGRESGDVVFMEDPFLSRRHAVIRATLAAPGSGAPPAFQLVDLGSSNGTFLRARGDVALVHGDQFRVGQQLFRVELKS